MRCTRVLAGLTAAVKALAALAQESRLEVYRLLVQAGPRGKAASDIAQGWICRPIRCRFT